MNWLLHRLWPRTPREWFQRLVGLGVLVVLVSLGMTWSAALRARKTVTTATLAEFGIPAPPTIVFQGIRPGPYATGRRKAPAAAWSAGQAEIGFEYLAPWYRRQMTQRGWSLQVAESNIGDPNVETLVARNVNREYTLEVRLSRAADKAGRTSIIVLCYPDAGKGGRTSGPPDDVQDVPL